jgi:hypothetical protein
MHSVLKLFKWQCTLMHPTLIIILLCLMPDDFTCQAETERVPPLNELTAVVPGVGKIVKHASINHRKC